MNREEHVWREAARYLGYGRTKPDRQTAELIDTSLEELSLLAVPRSVYSICTLQMEGEEICLGPFQIRSKNLARNLAGCSRAAIFAATLGAETDRAIHRYEHIHMAKAVVMQACAAAVLEDYCDAVQEQIREELQDEAWRENETQGQNGAQGQKEAQGERNGRFLRPRFSPGYGDLAIELQRELLAFLDAPKRIGLTATEAFMLTPMKSVTAVIGIGAEPGTCAAEGCSVCTKTDCSFRLEEKDEGGQRC